MNLAWLAAVLQPRDVTVHPNFAKTDDDQLGPSALAAIVLGGDWRRSANQAPHDPEVAEDLALVERALQIDALADAVLELGRRLSHRPSADIARDTALAIIVSAMSSELDDYELSISAVTRQIDRLQEYEGPDYQLLRAALLQQRALRERDSGINNKGTIREVAKSLTEIRPEECTNFRTSSGVAWSSVDSVRNMVSSLLFAASSMVGWDDPNPPAPLLSRFEIIRRGPSSSAARNAFAVREQYEREISQQFSRRFGSNASILGGPAPADLFHAQLGLELIGTPSVEGMRKEVALLRLIQPERSPAVVADALRLLRHAGAVSDLDLTLNDLKIAGPLTAIGTDARRVIAGRLSPALLRTLELKVLGAAADLLAPSEARVAFDAIAELLAGDGPKSHASTSQMEVLRREIGWLAAAQLASVSGMDDECAHLLLLEVPKVINDLEIADRGMRRALGQLDWSRVSRAVKGQWADLVSESENLSSTSVLIGGVTERPVDTSGLSPIDRLVSWTNLMLKNRESAGGPPMDTVALIRTSISKKLADTAQGHFSFGGPNAGDIAAALLTNGFTSELWGDLADYILDSNVPDVDRADALDRLARSEVILPGEIAGRVRAAAETIIEARPAPFQASDISPFPAAVRLLAAHGLVGPERTYELIATLMGSAGIVGRREAAATLATLAVRDPRPDLLAFAIPLSYDSDAEVAARAGHTLGHLVNFDGPLAVVAERRLKQLLAKDGVRVPLLVLIGFEEANTVLTEAIYLKIADLSSSHPSRAVRTVADRLRSKESST